MAPPLPDAYHAPPTPQPSKQSKPTPWRPLLLAAALHCCFADGTEAAAPHDGMRPILSPAVTAVASTVPHYSTAVHASAAFVSPASHHSFTPLQHDEHAHAIRSPQRLHDDEGAHCLSGQHDCRAGPPHSSLLPSVHASAAAEQPSAASHDMNSHSRNHQRAGTAADLQQQSIGKGGKRRRQRLQEETRKPLAVATQAIDFSRSQGFQEAPLVNWDLSHLQQEKLHLHLPVTFFNATVALLVLGLAGVGAVYLWRLWSQKKCQCPLCEGEYIIENPIGSGGFGTVFSVRHDIDVPEGDSQPRYVLKQITVAHIQEANEAQEEAKELRRLNHKHIVRYVDDFLHAPPQTPGREAPLVVCIVMEYCSYDLRKMIERTRRAKSHIPETLILSYFSQTLEALQYCHNRNIIHRDIKPQNLFITHDGNVRLGDFGLCRQVMKRVASLTSAGTDCYKSPEALLGQRRDGRKADVWALGMVVQELCVLNMAFEKRGTLGAKLLKHGRAALDLYVSEVPQHYSPHIRSLIRRMLHVDPDRRPAVDKLLKLKDLRAAKSFAKKAEAQALRQGKAQKTSLHPRPRRASVRSLPSHESTSLTSSDSQSAASSEAFRSGASPFLQDSGSSASSSASDSSEHKSSEGTGEKETTPPPLRIEVPQDMRGSPTTARPGDGHGSKEGERQGGSESHEGGNGEERDAWQQVPRKRRIRKPQQPPHSHFQQKPRGKGKGKGKKGRQRHIVFT